MNIQRIPAVEVNLNIEFIHRILYAVIKVNFTEYRATTEEFVWFHLHHGIYTINRE